MNYLYKNLLACILLLSLYNCSKDTDTNDACSQLKVKDIIVTYADDQSLSFKWTTISSAKKFKVKVLDGSNIVFEKELEQTNVDVQGLKPNTAYKISVLPFCSNDLSEGRDQQITSSTNNGCTAASPQNLKYSLGDFGVLKAEWDADNSIQEFEVSLVDKASKKFLKIYPSSLSTQIRHVTIDKISTIIPKEGPIRVNNNHVEFIVPTGINAELIVRPVCKADSYTIVGKNSISKDIIIESIFSNELINTGNLKVNCSNFDSIHLLSNSFRIPWSYEYSSKPLPDNSTTILYLQLSYSGTANFEKINLPLFVVKRNGVTKYYNNIQDCACSNLAVTKGNTSDVLLFSKDGQSISGFDFVLNPSGFNVFGFGFGNIFSFRN